VRLAHWGGIVSIADIAPLVNSCYVISAESSDIAPLFVEETGETWYNGGGDGMGRRYSDEERAQVLALLAAAGGVDTRGAATKVSKATGIPRETVRDLGRGSNPPPAEVRQEKNDLLIAAIRREIDAALGAMDGVRGKANYKDLTIGVGILVDKLQLLSGEDTQSIGIRLDRWNGGEPEPGD
jgi:hypothetical protein